jgi:hypothetical protein
MTMTKEEMQAEIDSLKAKLAEAQKPKAHTLTVKLAESGGMSVYGLGRYPVTMYENAWLAFKAFMPTLDAFYEANKDKMSKGKDDPRYAAYRAKKAQEKLEKAGKA